MEKNQQGKGLLLILIIVVLVILGLWWLMKQGYVPQAPIGENPAVQGVSDLDAASKDLDNTNLNQMDAGLNQLNSDAASF